MLNCTCSFHWIQIFTDHILHNGKIIQIPFYNTRRYFFPAKFCYCPKPPFPCRYDKLPGFGLQDGDGLKQPLAGYGEFQRIKRLAVKCSARLVGIWLDFGKWNFVDLTRAVPGFFVKGIHTSWPQCKMVCEIVSGKP